MNNPRHDKKTRAIYDNKDKLISVYKENPNEVYADWYFKEHYSDDRKWSVRIFKDFVLRNNISSIVDMGCGIGSYIEGALEGGVKIVKGYELCLENSSKFMSDNVKKFFNLSSFLLILFAAGLVAHGIHELQEAHIVPTIIEHVWDINHVVDEASISGEFLKTLVGYNGNPSLTEVISYFLYFIVIWVSIKLFRK